MSKQTEAAWSLVKRLAQTTTPEEEFEANKEDLVASGYEDVDEYISDMDDDTLCEAYAAFMEFVREAKEIVK